MNSHLGLSISPAATTTGPIATRAVAARWPGETGWRSLFLPDAVLHQRPQPGQFEDLVVMDYDSSSAILHLVRSLRDDPLARGYNGDVERYRPENRIVPPAMDLETAAPSAHGRVKAGMIERRHDVPRPDNVLLDWSGALD
jgi:hypothetical protein